MMRRPTRSSEEEQQEEEAQENEYSGRPAPLRRAPLPHHL